MWFLTCDGDLFGGRRLWLRPGSTHLLGRTSGRSDGDERVQYIDHKTVSRKHLILRIGDVRPGDSGRLQVRSEVTATDGSKMGTTINGVRLVQETRVLEGREFRIHLGNYKHEFLLLWSPVVLSFTSLGKKVSREDDPLMQQRSKLEQTDIKVLASYMAGDTTHTIAKKRNTPAALQTLAQARWLVTGAFVDAIGSVAHRESNDTSLLEQDFDNYWPRASDFIVPAGGEPVHRSNELLEPNHDRCEVFRDFTFIFLSSSQHELLLPVITAAGGKALLWEFQTGHNAAQDFVEYVKEVAGFKDARAFPLSQQNAKGGIVIVRLNGGPEGWKDFMRTVDIMMDQRSIEQNEFLDAILTLETGPLKRRLESVEDSLPHVDHSNTSAVRDLNQMQQHQNETEPPVAVPDSQPLLQNTSPEIAFQNEDSAASAPIPDDARPEQQPAVEKRRNRRILTKSRFQGFDDIEPSDIIRPVSPGLQPSNRNARSESGLNSPKFDMNEEADEGSDQVSRKRCAPSSTDMQQDMYDSMLTGVAALKRRKIHAAQNGEINGFTESAAGSFSGLAQGSKPRRRVEKEIDVLAEVQKRREAEEQQRQKDEDALREGLNGVNISELRNLAKVEEMAIIDKRQLPPQPDRNHRSERWDPDWNGRRNFKKFRPQGQQRNALRLQSVIVTLEEVPNRAKGTSHDYWLTPSSSRSDSIQRQEGVPGGHAFTPAQDPSHTTGISLNLRHGLEQSRKEDADLAVTDDIMIEEIAGTARDESLRSSEQTQSRSKLATKRPAASQAMSTQPKRAKINQTATSSGRTFMLERDDEGGELTFRRRRK